MAETVFGNMGTSFAGFQQTVVTGVPSIAAALGQLIIPTSSALVAPIGSSDQGGRIR